MLIIHSHPADLRKRSIHMRTRAAVDTSLPDTVAMG
jgi:hypothetical protein